MSLSSISKVMRPGRYALDLAGVLWPLRSAAQIKAVAIVRVKPKAKPLPQGLARKARLEQRNVEIAEAYAAGEKISLIAARFAIYDQQVSRIAKAMGVPLRGRPGANGANVERNAAIVTAYSAGDRICDIGARFGVSEQSVSKIAKKAGIPLRGRSWANVKFSAKAGANADATETATAKPAGRPARVPVARAGNAGGGVTLRPRPTNVPLPSRPRVIAAPAAPSFDLEGKAWCTQCELRVHRKHAERCSSPFCKLQVRA